MEPQALQSTMLDLDIEKMPNCICQREKCVYFCTFSHCPDKDQQYYCLRCYEIDDKHTTHKQIRINQQTSNHGDKWNEFRRILSETVEKADSALRESLPLIRNLEKAMLQSQVPLDPQTKWVAADYEKLKTLKDEVDQFYQNNVANLIVEMKLREIV